STLFGTTTKGNPNSDNFSVVCSACSLSLNLPTSRYSSGGGPLATSFEDSTCRSGWRTNSIGGSAGRSKPALGSAGGSAAVTGVDGGGVGELIVAVPDVLALVAGRAVGVASVLTAGCIAEGFNFVSSTGEALRSGSGKRS